MRKTGLCIFFLVLICAAFAQTDDDLTSNVNVFAGTGVSPVNDSGLTMPAATLPFGMIAWGPDPAEGKFYRYALNDTRGFSLTHLSGVGCSIYGDVPLMPIDGGITESPVRQPSPIRTTYQHANEEAAPGYYSVKLDNKIRVRLTVTQRAGIASMEFPHDNKPHSVLIDLSQTQDRFGVQASSAHINGRTVTGFVQSGGLCGRENTYRLYFAIEVQELPSVSGTFNEESASPHAEQWNGARGGAYLTFGESVAAIHLKVGLSFVSAANALQNLQAEIPGWNFEEVRNHAKSVWNDALSRIRVTGGSLAQRRIFYSALYHSLVVPSLFSDENGEYTGFDNRVHRLHGHQQYANFSGWDIYRCQVQLIAMLFPGVASDMAQSLVNDAEQGGGGLPIWPVANDESGEMVGDPSSIILANIYAFGGQQFDAKQALAAMLRGADDPKAHARTYIVRPMLSEYLQRGYVPESTESAGSSSVTLEYANSDFAISKLAASLGDKEDARRFLVRSGNWRRLFDSETRYIRPKNVAGNFLSGFDPGSGTGFIEGNSAQYTWMVPYNLAGIIREIGGKEAARTRLDVYFSRYGTFGGGPFFLISNEPSFIDPWIYNWTDRPWRTQEVVAKTLHDLFTDGPGGLPGNDDLGATSSWAVFAMLGIYPAIPGVGGFTVNTPEFAQSTIQTNGHELTITTDGARGASYIKRILLDSKPVYNYWLPWSNFAGARNLKFELTTQKEDSLQGEPPSFSDVPE